MISCSRAADYERAGEWIRAADDFTGRYGCPFLYTVCRTLYGGVLFSTGRWTQAEEELMTALRMFDAGPAHISRRGPGEARGAASGAGAHRGGRAPRRGLRGPSRVRCRDRDDLSRTRRAGSGRGGAAPTRNRAQRADPRECRAAGAAGRGRARSGTRQTRLPRGQADSPSWAPASPATRSSPADSVPSDACSRRREMPWPRSPTWRAPSQHSVGSRCRSRWVAPTFSWRPRSAMATATPRSRRLEGSRRLRGHRRRSSCERGHVTAALAGRRGDSRCAEGIGGHDNAHRARARGAEADRRGALKPRDGGAPLRDPQDRRAPRGPGALEARARSRAEAAA